MIKNTKECAIRFVNIFDTDKATQAKIRIWRNKSEIRKYMIGQNIISAKEHSIWLKQNRNNKKSKIWFVFCELQPIGIVQVKEIDLRNLKAEWGFYIGERGYRGRGIGKNILFELLRMFFEDMKFKILKTEVLETNKIALRLYNKFMFRKVSQEEKDGVRIVNMEFDSLDWKRNKGKIQNECI